MPAMMPPLQSAPVLAVGAVIWKDDKLLLIRRGHPPAMGSWAIPGGRQQLGETVFEAVAREITEETSLVIDIKDIVAVVDLIERHEGRVLYHFTVVDVLAEWVSGEAVAGDDADEVAWARLSDLPRFGLTQAALDVIASSAEKRAAQDAKTLPQRLRQV